MQSQSGHAVALGSCLYLRTSLKAADYPQDSNPNWLLLPFGVAGKTGYARFMLRMWSSAAVRYICGLRGSRLDQLKPCFEPDSTLQIVEAAYTLASCDRQSSPVSTHCYCWWARLAVASRCLPSYENLRDSGTCYHHTQGMPHLISFPKIAMGTGTGTIAMHSHDDVEPKPVFFYALIGKRAIG